MPLFYQQEINPHTRLGIWKIEETETFFLQQVPNANGVTHPQKRLQHLAGRYLLQYLFPEFPYHKILIAGTRKPYLPEEQFHFSISHSGNYAAAIVSQTQRTGVDVELYSPKTELIKNKFLTQSEQLLINSQPATDNWQLVTDDCQLSTPDEQLFTLFWCCKEAVYKYWGAGGVDFKKHICIQNIHTATKQVNVFFTKQYAQLVVHYTLFGQFCLAYVIS